MFLKKRGKTATFSRRTILLLTPIPLTVALINVSSRSLMNSFNATITNWDEIENSIDDLSQIIATRPISQEITNHGDVLEFQENQKKYKLEQLRPFNPLLFGSNFGYIKGIIEKSLPKPVSEIKNQEEDVKFLESNEKYLLTKENFEKTEIKDKGNLNLIIDIEFEFKDGKKLPIAASIDLSHMLFNTTGSFPIISLVEIKDETTNPNVYSIEFSKNEQQEQLEISLKKPDNDPFQKISISNFYIVFSDNPSISFSELFKQQSEEVNNVFNGEKIRVKKIFLDRWTKDEGNRDEGAKFKFPTTNGFWSSSCVDPYKIGGFIKQQEKQTSKIEKKSETSEEQEKTFRKQQMDSFINFSPFNQINEKEKSISFEPYTNAIPCSGIENDTKEKLKTLKEQLNWSMAPEAIKNIIDGKSEDQKTKIIQSAIMKNTTDNIKTSAFEEANQTTHSFNLKIEKETLKKKLLEHEKFKDLKKIPEISGQLQVNVPYLLTIYDPATNYIKHQKINLNVFLDLKSIYNQSQYTTNFLTYDIEGNNKTSTGISGKINFESGLALDIDGNLNIKLIVNTQGFFRKIKKENCDPRKWDSSSCDDKDKISSFIILKITDDPSVSSFLVDGRITGKSYEEDSEQENITTLEKFQKKIQNVQIGYVKYLDKTNNAEVFFERIDVADPVSQKLDYIKEKDSEIPNIETNKDKQKQYFLSSYYIPRRNYGEFQIQDDTHLKSLVMHASGSATLGGSFFTSMHYGTEITYCSSTKDNTNSTLNQECADGKKYEKIEKDKPNSSADSSIFKSLEINFQELKETSQEKPKIFDFQTIINKPSGEDKKWDLSKDKLEFIMKEEDGFSADKKDNEKAPNFSFVAVWYQISIWWDSKQKKICYYTKLTPISAIAGLSEKNPKGVKNKESVKSVGSSAKAGFQISKIEFKYEKSSDSI